jgi:hypothetical protein
MSADRKRRSKSYAHPRMCFLQPVFFCPAFCGNHMTYLRYGSVRDHRLDAVPYGLHKLPFFVGMFTVSNTPIKSVLGSCFFWLAFCARFLRALIRPCEASLVSAEPSSTSAPCAAAKPFEIGNLYIKEEFISMCTR